MKFSIIICAYNSHATLRPCLEAVLQSREKADEVLLIDDGSRDDTAEIAGVFSVTVRRLPENRGLPHARNEGAALASGDVLIFIDSDIILQPGNLAMIKERFLNHPETDGITGCLSLQHPNSDFFSQYKNLYMHYYFKALPERVDFFYGSIFALRRAVFEPFDENFVLTEDTELGKRLASKGRRIEFLKDLEVIHLKKYTGFSWIKNDFGIAYWWVFVWLKHCGPSGFASFKKRFSHAAPAQLLSLAAQAVLIFLLALTIITPHAGKAVMVMAGIWIVLNLRFLAFFFRLKGAAFGMKAIPVSFFDDIVRIAAIIGAVFMSFIHPMTRKKS